VLRFASLGSGSEGNALLIESGCTRVLIDCGFGHREAQKRLDRLGIAPESINAIIVTHEHTDHISGAARFSALHGAQLMMSYGTYWAARESFPRAYGHESAPQVRCFDSEEIVAIGDLELHPFPVPHDARQPVQCVVTDGEMRLGVLTDVGETTPAIERALSACDALVMEANHDEAMLAAGSYPASLKRRISGRHGHLSNTASAEILARLDCSKLQHLVAAHLSQSNNTAEHARAAFSAALNCSPEWIGIACQHDGFDWREIKPS
jgi:phosphoribosyl 1,2-cyclic phosphodiesterase